MSYVVGITDDGKNVAIYRGVEDHETVVTSVTEYNNYWLAEADRLSRHYGRAIHPDDLTVYFSSSMDYPRDSTSDPKVLALVAELEKASGR